MIEMEGGRLEAARSPLQIYMDECVQTLDQQYTRWRTNTWPKQTICIPEAAHTYEKADDESNFKYTRILTAQSATVSKNEAKLEDAVHDLFLSCPMGGIIIRNFDAKQVLKAKKKSSSTSQATDQKGKSTGEKKETKKKQSYEDWCTFWLLLHPSHGVVFIDFDKVNSKEDNSKLRKINNIGKYYAKRVQFKEMFKHITGLECKVNVSYLICLPNAKKEWFETSQQSSIMDNLIISSTSTIDHFLLAKFGECGLNIRNAFDDHAFCRFAAILLALLEHSNTSFNDDYIGTISENHSQNWRENSFGSQPILFSSHNSVEKNSETQNKLDGKIGDIRGKKAEAMVHAAFQSHIGGILIYSFEWSELWSAIRNKKIPVNDIVREKLIPYSDDKGFEIDALFFHPQCGMIVLESKATNYIPNLLKKTLTQSSKTIRRLGEVYHILTETDCLREDGPIIYPLNLRCLCEAISFVLCFPNAADIGNFERVEFFVSQESSDSQHNSVEARSETKVDKSAERQTSASVHLVGNDNNAEEENGKSSSPESTKTTLKVPVAYAIGEASVQIHDLVLSQKDLANSSAFQEFWEKRIALTCERNFFSDVNFRRFLALIYSYRSAKFTSSSTNAMEINRMISEHYSQRRGDNARDIVERKFCFKHENSSSPSLPPQNRAPQVSESPNNSEYNSNHSHQTRPLQSSAEENRDNEQECEPRPSSSASSGVQQRDEPSSSGTNSTVAPPSTAVNGEHRMSDQNRRKHDRTKKTIFLNDNQLLAFKKATEQQTSSKNLVLFGPPGSGKSVLIKILAKKAAEGDREGTVLLFVPTNEMAKSYKRFFEVNLDAQKRPILINPLRSEAIDAILKGNCYVFADEDYSGSWLPREKQEKNLKIIIAITIGQAYDPTSAQRMRKFLEKRLGIEHYEYLELNEVVRNTVNIFKYFHRSFIPDSLLTCGHEISGKKVEILRAKGTLEAGEKNH